MKTVSAVMDKRVLWRQCLYAENSFERAKGIMFWRSVTRPYVIAFRQKDRKLNAIHSYFCPPFDAVFLDRRGVVVDVVPDIPAGRLVTPAADCTAILECPPGGAAAKRITRGKRIRLV